MNTATIDGNTYPVYADAKQFKWNENVVLDSKYQVDPPLYYHECGNLHDGEFYHEDDMHYCDNGVYFCRDCGPCPHPECNYEG